MTILVLATIVFVCLTILMVETMYFNHKEKMAKLNAENNPLNKLFGGNKKEEEK